MKYIVSTFLVLALLAGCTATQKEPAAQKTETHKKTVWTAKAELFMEYDEPKQGNKTMFLLHLTDLRDFKPVSEGTLTLTFRPETGEAVIVKIDKPERPGIFKTDVTFNQPGAYTMTASLRGKTFSDEIIVPDIDVIGKEGKHDEAHHEETAGGDISFLKEQQWTIDFMAGLPAKQQVFSSFIATGEVIPAANAEATLSAPLSGTLSLSKQLPYIGKKVVKDELLAVIDPPISQQGGLGSLTASYAEAKNRVVLAQNEHERAKRLYEAKAVPKRRLEEAELSLESAKAAFEPLERSVQEMKQGVSGNKVILKAPFSGTVVELFTANGKAIEAGQPVLRLINTSTVWLKANVPATEIGSLGNLDKASFTIPGVEGEMKPSRLVTVNDVVDPKTRTVPVIFEVGNSAGRLKVGMFADVSIRTGHAENALTLPEEAFFEDEGRFFVFIQAQGEAFERREVKTGIRGSGLVQVLSGVKEDERVVLRGGYYVKLASLSSRMPDAHAGHGH
ncbi:MAG: efflux RND transporter periplasmic adaptor subunit [Gammaproteobacteria bacterium]|nr:efflux RND transporter periplasmic adaptor subunit [Gammaproteobacteria bacterium]